MTHPKPDPLTAAAFIYGHFDPESAPTTPPRTITNYRGRRIRVLQVVVHVDANGAYEADLRGVHIRRDDSLSNRITTEVCWLRDPAPRTEPLPAWLLPLITRAERAYRTVQEDL